MMRSGVGVVMLDRMALFWVESGEVRRCCHVDRGESPIPPASTPFGLSANFSYDADEICALGTRSPSTDHVWAGHPEQRTDTLWHRRRSRRARQPRPQLSAPLECRTEPGAIVPYVQTAPL